MTDDKTLKEAAEKIGSLFSSSEKKSLLSKEELMKSYMRLNLLLLEALFNQKIEKKEEKKTSPFFTSKILSSQNPHLIALVKQAYFSSKEAHFLLWPRKQSLLQSELSMKKVIEWRLSKYMKSQEQLEKFVEIMQKTPPDTFRYHLVTLLKETEEEPSVEDEIRKAEKEGQDRWDLWKHHADGDPFRISRT
jgi:hypothetical protein